MYFKKRGQAAIEFLMTYGWAIFIVLLSLGAIAYFGYNNPQKLLPEKCIFTNGIICKDTLITTNSINISLVNGLGRTIYDISATPIDFNARCVTSVNTASSDDNIRIDCELTQQLIKGERKRFKIYLNYTLIVGGYQKTSIGEIYSTVV
ncbi:MAG: hypothetical protein QXK76_00515 [Candidatus Woesearchaeota archaeon]